MALYSLTVDSRSKSRGHFIRLNFMRYILLEKDNEPGVLKIIDHITVVRRK
jgi:hypothetical protein